MTSRALFITIVLLLGLSPWAQAWQPDGKPRLGLSKACHPQLWSQRYIDTHGTQARSDLLKAYLEECSSASRAGQPVGAPAELLMLELRDHERPWQAVEFIDSTGILQRGHLLLQESSPRPMIVVACDFDCDPRRSPWLKTVAMQLYDEGRAHLFIATSPENRLDQQTLWISGGLQYGRELLEAGRWLQLFSPARGKISSAHLLGLGWAAKSVLDGQIFNDRNPIADDRRVFHSVVALCPAVQLDRALSEVDNPRTAESGELRRHLQIRINELRARDAGWSDWFSGWTPGDPLGDRWIRASLAQVSSPEFPWLNPFRANPPRTPAAWLEANNYLSLGQGAKTPGWVLGSTGDPRFPAEDHWRPLADQHRDPKKSNLHVVGVEDSTTCALPATHGWNFSSQMLRTLVLQEAYDIWPRYGSRRMAWVTPGTPKLQVNEVHADQHWSVNESGAVTVEFFIQRGSTFRSVVVPVSAAQLPPNLKYDHVDAKAATRQLNAWLRLHGDSEPLVQSTENVQLLELRD